MIVIAWFSCLFLNDGLGLCSLNCNTHAMTGNCSASWPVLADLLQVVSAKRGNLPLVTILNQAASTGCSGDNKENCLRIFAASMRVISAMTRNPPLHPYKQYGTNNIEC